MFSGDLTPDVAAETLAATLVCQKAGITVDRIHRGDLSEQEFELVIAAVEELEASPVRLEESADGSTERGVIMSCTSVSDDPQ